MSRIWEPGNILRTWEPGDIGIPDPFYLFGFKQSPNIVSIILPFPKRGLKRRFTPHHVSIYPSGFGGLPKSLHPGRKTEGQTEATNFGSIWC